MRLSTLSSPTFVSRFRRLTLIGIGAAALALIAFGQNQSQSEIGREVAIPRHMQDGEEYEVSIRKLIDYGRKLFDARFTIEEGAGRPLSKGTGAELSDPNSPLIFPRDRNRVSGPESNSCAGCHNVPVSGGFGDLATNVFVLAQRFDFATFDSADRTPTRGAVDERGQAVTLQSIGNSRTTVDMFGTGYYEMLARQITSDLQSIRDRMRPGQSIELISKGISFGILIRNSDGTWDTSRVTGLPPQSLVLTDPHTKPTLLIYPFSQAGAFVSLRQFTNSAYNQHLGMQSTERFGVNTDPDGDGVVNELTRADITAATVFQATLPVPRRVFPRVPEVAQAAQLGEQLFNQIGCATCHIPKLPLDNKGWIYTEPNPYNPAGNLQTGQAPQLAIDLTSDELPGHRLKPENGVVWVPLYTDFKLHNISKGPDDPNNEPLNQNESAGSDAFFAGGDMCLTHRLWAIGDKPNFFHHGHFTTRREAILNHFGEARASRKAFTQLSPYQQGSIVEFLKTLKADVN